MFWSRSKRQAFVPALPSGRRIYAVGDIHGRLDLFDELLASILRDSDQRGRFLPEIILLGDLIDRGPDSAGVIARAMSVDPSRATLVALKGNHEAAMLEALDGDRDMLRLWVENGGDAAMESFGIAPDLIAHGTADKLIDAARAAIAPEVVRWLAECPVRLLIGDYLFVHAGIRPGVKLEHQQEYDHLWIRGTFLNHRADHGFVVIHGHSISPGIDEMPNRIGLDTGAHRTGTLTAIGLERSERWYLQT